MIICVRWVTIRSMKTLKMAYLCDTPETRTRGLMGVVMPDNVCGVFLFPEKARWPMWGKNMMQDVYANFCSNGVVVESLPIMAGDLDAVVPVGQYRVMFESGRSFEGEAVAFEPDRVLIGC